MKPVNVLQFICPTGLFGAEMWILALAGGFDPEEIRCHLAVTHEGENQDIQLFDRFESLGLPAYKLPMKGRFDPLVLKKLLQLIRKKHIDIIHTHGYKSDILGVIAARLTGIRAVSTPHGFENADDVKLRLFIKTGCLSFRLFDRVVPLSDALKKNVHTMKVREEKIRLIRNGVDLREIESVRLNGKEFQLTEESCGKKKIGYVGQLAHRKNVDDLLTCFDLLYRENPNILLYLVGDGPMRAVLEKRAKSLACSKNILFFGYRTDRLRIMRHFDLFSMTSTLEGIPRCMMEAMALGIPVAAYNIPGVDQLIIHGKTGLMAKFGDIGELAQCWKKILFDQNLSAKLAVSGRDFVKAHFSGERMAKEYSDLYRDITVSD